MRTVFDRSFVVAIGASMIAGCAADSPATVTGPPDARIEEARLNATTDFEREILADGLITRAEYEEINQGLVTCMSDAGFLVNLVEQGGYYVHSMQYSDESDAALTRCQDGGGGALAGLYVDMLTNPNNLEYNELMLQCVKREGLLPEGFTVEDYRLGVGGFTMTANEDGSVEVSEEVPWTLPFSAEEPAFAACGINPSMGTTK